jgi:hypothetical protein
MEMLRTCSKADQDLIVGFVIASANSLMRSATSKAVLYTSAAPLDAAKLRAEISDYTDSLDALANSIVTGSVAELIRAVDKRFKDNEREFPAVYGRQEGEPAS